MNKTLNGIIAVVVVGGAVFFAYQMATKGKQKFARRIIADGNVSGGIATLITLDEPYLKEWAKASKKGAPTFTYNGKMYNTKGGTAVK